MLFSRDFLNLIFTEKYFFCIFSNYNFNFLIHKLHVISKISVKKNTHCGDFFVFKHALKLIWFLTLFFFLLDYILEAGSNASFSIYTNRTISIKGTKWRVLFSILKIYLTSIWCIFFCFCFDATNWEINYFFNFLFRI